MGSRVQAQLPAGVVASAWGEQGHRVGWGPPAGSLTTSPLDALYRKALGTCVSTSPDPHWPDTRPGERAQAALLGDLAGRGGGAKCEKARGRKARGRPGAVGQVASDRGQPRGRPRGPAGEPRPELGRGWAVPLVCVCHCAWP